MCVYHAGVEAIFPPGVLPSDPPTPFDGGTLAFYPDHIELNGELILERGGPGHAWKVMQVLRAPRDNGRLPQLSAPRLAKAVDSSGRLSDGAINSCVHTLRANIAETMLTKANKTVCRNDVIANLGKGYHLAEWLAVEQHDSDIATMGKERPAQQAQSAVSQPTPHPSTGRGANGIDAFSDRQHWVLDQLRHGVRLTREMVEQQFGIKDKQAKRELAGLSNRGMIEFIRTPRPGYYVLLSKPRRQGKAQ
ncbi:MAG: hypothetical protein WD468_11750 [Pirellulales bacterium]